MDCRTQLITTHDLRISAAKVLSDPDKWAGQGAVLAGDDIRIGELQNVFQRAVGEELLQTYGIPGHPVLWLVKDTSKRLE